MKDFLRQFLLISEMRDHESDPRIIELARRSLADLKELDKILSGNEIAKDYKLTMDNEGLRTHDVDSIPESNKRGWLSVERRTNYNLDPNSPRGYGGRRDRYF